MGLPDSAMSRRKPRTPTAPATGQKTTKVPPDQGVRQRSPMAASVVKNHRTVALHGGLDYAIE
jgi:hypothetical protein